MMEDEIKGLLSMISSTYPNFELTPQRVEIWKSCLADIPGEYALKNYREHMLSNSFPPVPADIVRLDRNRAFFREQLYASMREDAFNAHMRNGGEPEDFDSAIWDEQERQYIMSPEPILNLDTEQETVRILSRSFKKALK